MALGHIIYELKFSEICIEDVTIKLISITMIYSNLIIVENFSSCKSHTSFSTHGEHQILMYAHDTPVHVSVIIVQIDFFFPFF
jgi:hypothetical protein